MCAIDQAHFKNDDAAFAYLEGIRWSNGPVCAHCGTINHAYALANHRYRCAEKGCRKDFTVRVGTVFEDSPIKLHKWLLAAYLVCSSKKGISSHQLHRMLGVTYKTAWFMSHRLREAMNIAPEGQLGGDGDPVEVDETFWGNFGKQQPGARGTSWLLLAGIETRPQFKSFPINTASSGVSCPPISWSDSVVSTG